MAIQLTTQSTLIGKVHLPCSNQPSCFPPQPASSVSSKASLYSFHCQPIATITSSRFSKSATFLLAGWRLLHSTELPGDLPALLGCHTLTMNTIELQLSDAVADTSMLQCSAQFRILFINAHFVADNACHALASSATVRPTFNVKEEVVVIRNGWTPKKKKIATMPLTKHDRPASSSHDHTNTHTVYHSQQICCFNMI